jgi:ABC-type uncharacterized transport system permease subunit
MTLTGIAVLMLIGLFSFLTFWKPHPVLFLLLFAVCMVAGLLMPDTISDNTATTEIDITFGLFLVGYGLLCAGAGLKSLIWRNA